MRRLGRWLGRLLLAALLLVLALLAPSLWVEAACRGKPLAETREPILPPEQRRAEARTLLTWPEWHIVRSYEDYAAVIAAGDPHDFGFLRAVGQFWSSFCAVNRAAAAHGGADWETRRTIHVIGASFTAELLLKALYEETLGRAAAWARGERRAPLDDLSARQAADYAAFLRQVPWYRWDFRADAAALSAASTGSLRDRERALALGLEYRAKAAYAGAIAAAVAATGQDETTMRSLVAGLSSTTLAQIEGVTVIAERPEGVEIETPRYAAFTALARELARAGGRFVEIAGNDDILVTGIVAPDLVPAPGTLARLPLQGREGERELRLLPVADLGAALLDRGRPVEHVYDY